MSILHLALKTECFDAIRDGKKTEEYRLWTPYWRKRLEGREYDAILLAKGYPASEGGEGNMRREWAGVTVKTIVDPDFGPNPVLVFAINVSRRQPQESRQARPAPIMGFALPQLTSRASPARRARSVRTAASHGVAA